MPSLPPDRYLPFLEDAAAALALLEASVFFWFLTAESCFVALSLAFGDLSPMFLPPVVWVESLRTVFESRSARYGRAVVSLDGAVARHKLRR